MSPLFLLVPIVLPIIGGLILLTSPHLPNRPGKETVKSDSSKGCAKSELSGISPEKNPPGSPLNTAPPAAAPKKTTPEGAPFRSFICYFPTVRSRIIFAEAVVCLTSIAVWLCLLMTPDSSAEIFSFTGGFSISFFLDPMGKLFSGMISVMWPLVMLYAFEYMQDSHRHQIFFAFYVMTYGITLGIAFAANMITLYVFFEMLTLVTIPLVAHYGDHDSNLAGRRYAAYTIGGASLAFFAVVVTTIYGDNGAFIYGGSLNPGFNASLLNFAYILGFFGFGTKAAVFPMHDWLPKAAAAPTPVTALLHAVAVVNSGVFAVTRLTYFVYGPAQLYGSRIQNICLLTAIFSMVFAAVMALRERHFKRRLAYSTMSNLSYMLFGIMLLTPDGIEAGMLHMLFHSIIKMSLFLCAGAFIHSTGKAYIYEINGIGPKMPVTFVFYTFGALSLTGIPLFCGFISKWRLLTAGVSEGTPYSLLGAGALILSAFLCAMYTLTISVRAFFPGKGKRGFLAEAPDSSAAVSEAGFLMLLPIVFFGIINIVFGIFPEPVLSFFTGFTH